MKDFTIDCAEKEYSRYFFTDVATGAKQKVLTVCRPVTL